MRNIAMITMHSCPAGRFGTRDVGGMNVYVSHVARELAKFGCKVDIYTRGDRAHGQHIVEITPFVRVIHVKAGPVDESKHELSDHVPAFVDAVDGFRQEHRFTYELVHSHYWLSGIAGKELSKRWGVPHVTMFHTTALTKLLARIGEQEPEGRVEGGARGHGLSKRDCRLDRAGTVGYQSSLRFGTGEDQRIAGGRGPRAVSTDG